MSDLLVKVPFDALETAAPLEYNLYSLSGETLYRAGHRFSGEDLLRLRRMGLYRHTQDLPRRKTAEASPRDMDFIDHEGYLFHFPAGLTEDERLESILAAEAEPLLDDELVQAFQGPLGYFWERIRKGASPDIALCEIVRDRLIAEVTSKVEQIRYLSQVRVRDEVTYSHILDVTALSIALAIQAGFSRQEVREIALAAILHDLGKLMIPRHIMFKPSRLTEKEFRVMQLHPELGYKIIVGHLHLPDHIARPALEHQEMYGGGGYPYGLSGTDIHPYSHIVKIADVYDALTSKRPYKESIPSAKAVRIMLSEGEKSFHPDLLRTFARLSNYRDPALELVR
jgi:hypothetical protein